MDQLKLKTEIIQQLIHSDLETDLATMRFLKQFTIYSLANQVRGLPVYSFPNILISLSTVQKFHFEKVKLYQVLAKRNLRPFVSEYLIEKLEEIEKHVNDTLGLMESLNFDPSIRKNLDDLFQNVYSKLGFYRSMFQVPAEPWISPVIKFNIGFLP